MACPIESLDWDIQINILSHAPDVETLVSLLKASPRLYQAFSSARNRILTKVLINTFGVEQYAEALLATKVMMFPERELSQDEIHRLNTYHLCMRALTAFPENDLLTSILLCKLNRALNYHVERFSRAAFDFLGSCAKQYCGEITYYRHLQTHINSALSSSEQLRLRRAFLRFQLYCRLCRFCNPSDVLRSLPPWEAEEMMSVWTYYFVGIEKAFDLSKQDFLSAYTAEAGPASTFAGLVNPRKKFFEVEYASYRDRLKAHMLASGLCFLRRLFESTGEARLALLTFKYDFVRFLIPPSMTPFVHCSMPIFYASYNSCQQPNFMWRRAQTEYVSRAQRIFNCARLREWGYVFWDLRRMRYSGILMQSPSDIARLSRAGHVKWDRARASRMYGVSYVVH